MPPAAHFRVAESGERPIKAGDFDFPRLNNPPLKTTNQGGLRAPLLDVPPREGTCGTLLRAAGPLRSKAPPPESWQENSLGEFPKRGNRSSPSLVVFKEGVQGEGNRNPSPC